MKMSISSLAQELSLSRNTVSKALRLDPSVSAETQRRVINAARAHGYQKLTSEAIRFITTQGKEKNTRNFAVLIARSTSDFWNRIMIGIVEEFKRWGGNCQLSFVTQQDEESLTLPSDLIRSGVEGIICMSVFSQPFTKMLKKSTLPVVFLDMLPCKGVFPNLNGDTFILEGERSVYEITSDLIRRGCRNFSFVGNIYYCRTINDRWKGFCHALRDAGIPLRQEQCFIDGGEKAYYVYDTLASVLDTFPHDIDAFVCANDTIASMVLRYCKQCGRHIPQEVAITGFDNMKESQLLEPSITTVNFGSYRLGRRLAQQLIWRLQNPDMPFELTYIETEPIIRASSGIDMQF